MTHCHSADHSADVEVLKSKLEEYVHQVESLRKEFKEIKAELHGSKNTMDSVFNLVTEILQQMPSNSK